MNSNDVANPAWVSCEAALPGADGYYWVLLGTPPPLPRVVAEFRGGIWRDINGWRIPPELIQVISWLPNTPAREAETAEYCGRFAGRITFATNLIPDLGSSSS